MALSELKLVNAALYLVGAKKLSQVQLTAALKKSATAIASLYEMAYTEMFELPFDWKFCITRTELIPSEIDPEFGYDYQFVVPTNIIRPLAVVDEDNDDIEYKWRSELLVDATVEYDVILSNQETLFLKYMYIRTDESKWPAWFAKLVVINLALYLCEPLKQKSAKINQLERMFDKALTAAVSANALLDVDVSDEGLALDRGNTDVIDAAIIKEVTKQRIIARGVRLYVGTNYIYYGADSDEEASASMVEGLSDSVDSNQKNRTVTIVATAGYGWYCYPARLGVSIFYIDGTLGGFEDPETVSITSAVGVTENYYCYRTTNEPLATISVIVGDG